MPVSLWRCFADMIQVHNQLTFSEMTGWWAWYSQLKGLKSRAEASMKKKILPVDSSFTLCSKSLPTLPYKFWTFLISSHNELQHISSYMSPTCCFSEGTLTDTVPPSDGLWRWNEVADYHEETLDTIPGTLKRIWKMGVTITMTWQTARWAHIQLTPNLTLHSTTWSRTVVTVLGSVTNSMWPWASRNSKCPGFLSIKKRLCTKWFFV